MGLISEDFKTKYNESLARYRKGAKWTDDGARNSKQIEGGCKRLNELAKELSLMMNEYKKITGKKMTDELVLKGFE